jgi:hypothetical protein
MNQFPKGMSRRNKRQCQEGYQHEMQGAGFNLADCGNCGSTFLHRTEHEVIECPFCDYRSEPCDFPDHFHDGFADSAEFHDPEPSVDKEAIEDLCHKVADIKYDLQVVLDKLYGLDSNHQSNA